MQSIPTLTATALANYFQDTLRHNIQVKTDSLVQVADSVASKSIQDQDNSIIPETIYYAPVEITPAIDTVSVCPRIPFTGITYYDADNLAMHLDKSTPDKFPFTFISAVRDNYEQNQAILVQSLKSGEKLPVNVYHIDWLIPLVFCSALILGIIRMVAGNFFKSMIRFITFQGISDSSSREVSDIYQLPATLLNLGSFISISLFVFLLTIRYGNAIPGLTGFAVWAVAFVIIIVAITLRHLICSITGNISNQQELFAEYLRSVYDVYRIAGIFYLLLVILLVYSSLLPKNLIFKTGIYGAGLLYIIRISRLLLIFIKRRISLFYYILYLCALEILPVVVLVKYVAELL